MRQSELRPVDVYLRFGDAPAPTGHPELATDAEHIGYEARPAAIKRGDIGDLRMISLWWLYPRPPFIGKDWFRDPKEGGFFRETYRAAESLPASALPPRYGAARSVCTAIYYMLRDGVAYHDLGPEHFDRIDREAVVKSNVRRLQKLGYHVSLQPMAS